MSIFFTEMGKRETKAASFSPLWCYAISETSEIVRSHFQLFIGTVTAVDYILMRFPDRDWLSGLPALRDWRGRQQGRPSIESTLPRV